MVNMWTVREKSGFLEKEIKILALVSEVPIKSWKGMNHLGLAVEKTECSGLPTFRRRSSKI